MQFEKLFKKVSIGQDFTFRRGDSASLGTKIVKQPITIKDSKTHSEEVVWVNASVPGGYRLVSDDTIVFVDEGKGNTLPESSPEVVVYDPKPHSRQF